MIRFVYLMSNTSSKVQRAIKTAHLSHASSLMDECMTLIHLQSPFVACCYGDEIAHAEHDLLGHSMQYILILEYCFEKTIAD